MVENVLHIIQTGSGIHLAFYNEYSIGTLIIGSAAFYFLLSNVNGPTLWSGGQSS
jgi:hypothetical protein